MNQALHSLETELRVAEAVGEVACARRPKRGGFELLREVGWRDLYDCTRRRIGHGMSQEIGGNAARIFNDRVGGDKPIRFDLTAPDSEILLCPGGGSA